MSLLTPARPFAESAFAVAKSVGQLMLWGVGLEALALAYKDSSMQRVLNNPSFDRAQQIQWLADLAQLGIDSSSIAENKNKDFSRMFTNFIRQIAQDRSFLLLPAISHLFQEYLANEKNIKSCIIKSATDLQAEARDMLQAALAKRFAQQVSCEFRVDPTLKAGVLIQAGDWVVDGTMLARIHKLSERLLA